MKQQQQEITFIIPQGRTEFDYLRHQQACTECLLPYGREELLKLVIESIDALRIKGKMVTTRLQPCNKLINALAALSFYGSIMKAIPDLILDDLATYPRIEHKALGERTTPDEIWFRGRIFRKHELTPEARIFAHFYQCLRACIVFTMSQRSVAGIYDAIELMDSRKSDKYIRVTMDQIGEYTYNLANTDRITYYFEGI